MARLGEESLSLLRAIIFDFDGVLVNSEPVIMKLFQHMAAKEGWTLSDEEYYRDYLALDDRGMVEHLYSSHGRALDVTRRYGLVQEKARLYMRAIRDGVPTEPGAVEFVHHVAARYALAIASGSLRHEIEYLLEKIGLGSKFPVLVSAEDTERSKPEPEIYLKALAQLQHLRQFRPAAGENPPVGPLQAAECLAIEDAPGGVEAAHAAGIRCLALTHTRPVEELQHADWVRSGFPEVNLVEIEAGFE